MNNFKDKAQSGATRLYPSKVSLPQLQIWQTLVLASVCLINDKKIIVNLKNFTRSSYELAFLFLHHVFLILYAYFRFER